MLIISYLNIHSAVSILESINTRFLCLFAHFQVILHFFKMREIKGDL